MEVRWGKRSRLIYVWTFLPLLLEIAAATQQQFGKWNLYDLPEPEKLGQTFFPPTHTLTSDRKFNKISSGLKSEALLTYSSCASVEGRRRVNLGLSETSTVQMNPSGKSKNNHEPKMHLCIFVKWRTPEVISLHQEVLQSVHSDLWPLTSTTNIFSFLWLRPLWTLEPTTVFATSEVASFHILTLTLNSKAWMHRVAVVWLVD